MIETAQNQHIGGDVPLSGVRGERRKIDCENEGKKKIKYLFCASILFPAFIHFPKKVKLFISFFFSLTKRNERSYVPISRFSRFISHRRAFCSALMKCRNWFCQSLLVISAEIRGRRLARQVDNEPPKMRCEHKTSIDIDARPQHESTEMLFSGLSQFIEAAAFRNLIYLSFFEPPFFSIGGEGQQ